MSINEDIKGTPLDPNFGFHNAADYAKMLGEGQSCEDYAKDRRQYKDVEDITPEEIAKYKQEYPPTHLYANTSDIYPEMNYIPDNENLHNEKVGILPEDCPGKDLHFGAGAIGIPGCGLGTEHTAHSYSGFSCSHVEPDDTMEARMNELTCPPESQNTAIPGFEGHHTPIPGTGMARLEPHHLRPWHLVPENYQTVGSLKETNKEEQRDIPKEEMTFHYDPSTNMQRIPRSEEEHNTGSKKKKENIIHILKRTISR